MPIKTRMFHHFLYIYLKKVYIPNMQELHIIIQIKISF